MSQSVKASAELRTAPPGYWAFDVSAGEPYIQGQKDYLYKAIQWGRNHNVKVMASIEGWRLAGSFFF